MGPRLQGWNQCWRSLPRPQQDRTDNNSWSGHSPACLRHPDRLRPYTLPPRILWPALQQWGKLPGKLEVNPGHWQESRGTVARDIATIDGESNNWLGVTHDRKHGKAKAEELVEASPAEQPLEYHQGLARSRHWQDLHGWTERDYARSRAQNAYDNVDAVIKGRAARVPHDVRRWSQWQN